MRKFWIRKAPLQVANTDYAGWLYLSTESMHPEETADSANLYIKKHCEKNGRTPFTIACEHRMIWDEKAKSKELSIKERQAKKALHFVCEKGWEQDTSAYIHAWLRSSLFQKLSNIPMKFVPNFSRGQGKVYTEKFCRAVQKHMQLTAFNTRTTTCLDFKNIDARCDYLPITPPSAT
jgi:hypothetical protein